MLEDYLSEFFAVHAASSLREAKSILEKESVDLILTDLAMPGGYGDELIGVISRVSRKPTPTLIMTGLLELELKLPPHCKVISKPFHLELLKEKLFELIEFSENRDRLDFKGHF